MRPVYQIIRTPAVVALVGSNVFQDRASPDQTAPYVVWSRQIVPLMGLAHRPIADRESVTIDIFAQTEAQRDAILVAVRDAIEPVGVVLNIQSLGSEADTNIWRMTLDADIFDER